jgi:hypothetical protein
MEIVVLSNIDNQPRRNDNSLDNQPFAVYEFHSMDLDPSATVFGSPVFVCFLFAFDGDYYVQCKHRVLESALLESCLVKLCLH